MARLKVSPDQVCPHRFFPVLFCIHLSPPVRSKGSQIEIHYDHAHNPVSYNFPGSHHFVSTDSIIKSMLFIFISYVYGDALKEHCHSNSLIRITRNSCRDAYQEPCMMLRSHGGSSFLTRSCIVGRKCRNARGCHDFPCIEFVGIAIL
jgi:hypothetical protein